MTDRVEAENALRASEERFRALTEYISDITIVANAEGKTTYVSPAAYRATGYIAEELVGNIRKKILTPESANIIENALIDLKDTPSKTIQIPQVTGKHKDGHRIYFEGSVTNMLHIPGVDGFVFTGREITERVKTEHVLQDIQLRYQALFDRSIDAVFIISLDQKFLAANDRAADLLGYPVEELLAMGVTDVVLQDEFSESQRSASALLAGETPSLYERTFVRKDKTLVVGEISAALVQDSEGNPAYIQSIVRDVTGRKQTEKALIEKDYRYQSLFNQNNDAVLIVGLDGIIQNVNQRAADMHEYEVEEMIGMKIQDLSAESEKSDTLNVIEELVKGKELPVYERQVVTKSGKTFPIEINVALVQDSEGNPLHYQSITRDISQRKKAEEQLRHLATHDALTGLPNRTLFYERLNRAVARAQRQNTKIAVFFLDLDDFKLLNDSYGHAAGDELLKKIGARLCENIRENDTVARLSGDEFTLILEDISTLENAELIAEKVMDTLSAPFLIADIHEVYISSSLGICLFPEHAGKPEELLQKADQAMYEAKRRGKNRYQIFSGVKQ
jgi:diguanylate cyclase (GGDEF)-like protein/PAS domain S-box-containing protein